ncbi:Abi-alpha family protein [Saccharopolyspora sp. ID03-671]|uniref:Abi-alpha family protein n=1 Tax=Saccharopolyspora sp. ID03-671 TaxID=3073066 RepID=UPI00324E241F
MTGEIELSRRADEEFGADAEFGADEEFGAEEDRGEQRSAGSKVLGGLLGLAGRVGRDVARTGMGLMRELPGGVEVERQVQAIEKAVSTGVRVWIESVDDPVAGAEGADPEDDEDGEVEPVQDGLREAMSELLFRSATSSKAEAREYLYAGILRMITPDEARVLAGLGDGAAYPVVHVTERSGIGGASRFVLRNGSTVGRAVGVALPDEVPHYLTRLHALGLVEIGAELDAMDDQYEILQTESRIREALRSGKSTKVVRRSVRMSELGTRFWRRCDPTPISGADEASKA